MNTRCRNVLWQLLQSQKPLASSLIASQLNISPRMVRYTLPTIKAWLSTKGAQLVSKRGRGIFIVASPDAQKRIIGELTAVVECPVFLLATERLYLLIFDLLVSDQPLVIKQLEHQLNVSRTTVLRDLDRAEEWLGQHNLQLLRRPHYGLKIAGKECDLRGAMADLLRTSLGETYLLNLCGEGQSTAGLLREATGSVLRQVLSPFLRGLELRYSNKLVAALESKMNVQFTDNAHVGLVLYLAISMRRIQERKSVEPCPECLDNLKRRKEFSIAREIGTRIERYLGVTVSDPEVAFIARHILGAEVRGTIADVISERPLKEGVRPEVKEAVDSLLAKASGYLHPSIMVDQELIYSLNLHFTSVFDKLQFGLPFSNPLLGEVKERYPYIFEVAARSCAVLEDKIGLALPEGEIGYVAMLLAAAMERLSPSLETKRRVLIVCNAGVATAWLLVSRLRAKFPEVEIVGVVSARDLQKKALNNADLIISTIPVAKIDDIPAVVVSPFLSDKEITKIGEAFQERDKVRALSRPTDYAGRREPSLGDLITVQTTRLSVRAESWQEVVYRAGKLLLDIDAIEPRYIEAMVDIIVKHGPYMVIWPGVVLLHAFPDDGVKRLCMSLVTLETPIPFGHPENDPVDIAIALGAVDTHQHLTALSELQDMLENKEAVSKIRHARRVSEILEVIAGFSGK